MRKKILFIVQLPPPIHGSSLMNQYVVNSAQLKSRFNSIVLPMNFSNSIGDLGTLSFKKIWLMLLYIPKLIITVLRHKPAIAYFTIAPIGNAFLRDALFVWIVKMLRTKTVLHMHGKGIRPEMERSSFRKRIYAMVFKNSHVILLAETLYPDVAEICPPHPFILPNGIEDIDMLSTTRDDDSPRFLYLSNLLKSKGIETFLAGLIHLNRKGIRFYAKIAGAPGDINYQDIRELLEKEKLQDNVILLGPVFGTEKEKCLKDSNIFVLPTAYPNEAFPVSILEAMRSGHAVVTTDNGAIPEIIENKETGLISAMGDQQALISNMEIVAKDKNLRKLLGEQAQRKFKKEYTLATYETNLVGIFNTIMNKNAS